MVQLSAGVQCTRVALFVLNILFLLIGLSVMGLGIYIKAHGKFRAVSEIYSISEALGDNTMQWIGIGMILAGILTACFAGLGFLGAVLKNQCFLYIYSVFLTFIILFEFAAVIVILVFRTNLWNTYDSGFMELFHQAYSQNQTKTIQIIENLEHQFQCCGVNGASDYFKYGYQIPKSCYANQATIYSPYYQGCAQAVAIWVWNELPIIAVALGGILFIEILCIISSLVLGVAISHSSRAEAEYYAEI